MLREYGHMGSLFSRLVLALLLFVVPDSVCSKFASGTEMSPAPCLVTEATNAVCGADFTVWLSSIEGSSILYDLAQT